MNTNISHPFIAAWGIVAGRAAEIEAENGWLDRPDWVEDALQLCLPAHIHEGIRQATEVNDGQSIALMHSELSEGLEGLRKNLMDDHLPDRKMIEVELADVVLRIMGYAQRRGLDVASAILEKQEYNAKRPHRHGGKRF